MLLVRVDVQGYHARAIELARCIMQAEMIRSEVTRLLRQVPFHPFVLLLENGDRVFIEHPENIAFDSGTSQRPGSREFRAITGGLWFFGTFEKVTSVAQRDVHGSANGEQKPPPQTT
jgi:hypothetical protein